MIIIISIIIPTYNRADTIEKSIKSILSQSCSDFELIVVDDNSSDNTEAVIRKIKDVRIKYIKHEKNKGANAARNTGINNSNGSFIAFQDSDDEWINNKLEIQMNELIENNADIVASSYYRHELNNIRIIPNKNIKDENIKKKLLCGNFISTQTILGKKECFIEEKFDEDFPRFQDWELMIRMSYKYKIHFINIPLVNVFVQSDSISNDFYKAVSALEMIINKHKDKLFTNKNALCCLYKQLGYYSKKNNDFSTNYYKKVLECNLFNVKTLVQLIIFEIKKLKHKNNN